MDTGVESSNSGNGVLEFKNRQKSAECLALRKQILPHVVMLHCHLCQETAEWMASSLQQMVSHLAMSSSSNAEPLSSALALLDPSTSTPSSGAAGPSPKSLTPLSPTYWTTQAMEIADTLASDSYGIPVHEQILEQMAQLTVLHLQYCADLEQSPSL
uniref:Uncharacterized protein n=1 Tax=Entomoneis paludosa TaxID=265537 RepID=A0A7S3DUJ3_9STRA